MTHETFHPRRPVDPTKLYAVDFFDRNWKGVDSKTPFLPGGRYFLVHGRSLREMLKKCPTLDEEEEAAEADRCKRNARRRINECFTGLRTKEELVAAYTRLFYRRPREGNTEGDFKRLCVKSRGTPQHGPRYHNRLRFSFLVVNSLGCDRCNDKCVHAALKRFYGNDEKCAREVSGLVARGVR